MFNPTSSMTVQRFGSKRELLRSMMAWAYYEEGKAAHWMRHDLDAVLEPYFKKRKTKSV